MGISERSRDMWRMTFAQAETLQYEAFGAAKSGLIKIIREGFSRTLPG
jgi:hypothetical protein